MVPLYVLAIIMLKFSSRLFVGLAFDSGGVSGGALTSAFLTPLTLGTAQAVAASAGPGAQSVLINGFGIIAFISVTPLIAVQALGIIYDTQLRKAQKLIRAAEAEELKELASLAMHAGKAEASEPTNSEAVGKEAVDNEALDNEAVGNNTSGNNTTDSDIADCDKMNGDATKKK